ncbi:MAG: hypothetical protein P8Y93_08340 [Acidobacteriota bacterium]|jgi:hypothetical protein
MEYLDVLRRNGWLADPSDRVRVVAIHDPSCPANRGRPCRCHPQLVLAADLLASRVEVGDPDLPVLDAASNE